MEKGISGTLMEGGISLKEKRITNDLEGIFGNKKGMSVQSPWGEWDESCK